LDVNGCVNQSIDIRLMRACQNASQHDVQQSTGSVCSYRRRERNSISWIVQTWLTSVTDRQTDGQNAL